jgi:hypothetical protein
MRRGIGAWRKDSLESHHRCWSLTKPEANVASHPYNRIVGNVAIMAYVTEASITLREECLLLLQYALLLNRDYLVVSQNADAMHNKHTSSMHHPCPSRKI